MFRFGYIFLQIKNNCQCNMGVDVSHIVRHEFRHTDDVEASMDFVEQTIDRLKRNLLIGKIADSVCFSALIVWL